MSALDIGDAFCEECFINAWNAGARFADAHWADQPHERSRGNAPHRDELSPDGRSPYLEYQGYYKRKPGDIAE